jgi:hypothetical protein
MEADNTKDYLAKRVEIGEILQRCISKYTDSTRILYEVLNEIDDEDLKLARTDIVEIAECIYNELN